MKQFIFITLIAFSFSLTACTNGFVVDTHTPDVVEQDRPYELDAGTTPNEVICSTEENIDGQCG